MTERQRDRGRDPRIIWARPAGVREEGEAISFHTVTWDSRRDFILLTRNAASTSVQIFQIPGLHN